MSLLACPACPGRCARRVPVGAGWVCAHLLELGIAFDQLPVTEDAPRQDATLHPRATRAVALIEQHRCPCCNGGLGPSDFENWERCVECRCAWQIEVSEGHRYALAVRQPGCPSLVETAETAALAARRTA